MKIGIKFSKDQTYVNVILSDDKESITALLELLCENRITNLATDGYTRDWQKTVAVTAYAATKEQSRLIDRYLLSCSTKFKRLI